MSFMKRIERMPPVILVGILLVPVGLIGLVSLVAIALPAGTVGKTSNAVSNSTTRWEERSDARALKIASVTVGSDVARFRERYGDDKVMYALVAPRNEETSFRYFGFEISPESTVFTGDQNGTVKVIALLKHVEIRPSDRKPWSEVEILEVLQGFTQRSEAEWIEMDKNDRKKGFRVWADMSSISSQGGVIALYDESYLGLVIGNQPDIVKFMDDFKRAKLIDLRKIELQTAE